MTPRIYAVFEGNEVEPDGSINRLNRGNLSLPHGAPIPRDLEYWRQAMEAGCEILMGDEHLVGTPDGGPGTEPCPRCGGTVNSQEVSPGEFFCWAHQCGHSWSKHGSD